MSDSVRVEADQAESVPVSRIAGLKAAARRILPKPVVYSLRVLKNTKDHGAVLRFLGRSVGQSTFGERFGLVRKMYAIHYAVDCPHYQHEILSFIEATLSLTDDVPGCLVEAGCYKGGSTAKFSHAAKKMGRELIVFDSFEGIPEHSEQHEKNIFGRTAEFPQGSWRGTIDEVEHNLEKYGERHSCRLAKGWFEDTMPTFSEPIAVAYLDVDLASSTRTCLKHLYPLLSPGGVLLSQDGHLPLVIEVFRDEEFWREEIGCQPPDIHLLGQVKLLKLVKPR